VNDDRRLFDRRQALLDPVGEHRAGERAELAEVARPLSARERDQQRRLARRVSQRAEDLVAGAAPARVDRGAHQHHGADPPRSSHRQLGDDLAAHRVGDQRRPLEPGHVQPVPERVGEAPDAERGGRGVASSMAWEVGCEYRAAGGEDPGERKHVVARDSVAVDEHDRRPIASGTGVHLDASHVVPATLEGAHGSTSSYAAGARRPLATSAGGKPMGTRVTADRSTLGTTSGHPDRTNSARRRLPRLAAACAAATTEPRATRVGRSRPRGRRPRGAW
jgi:hypothetical protein